MLKTQFSSKVDLSGFGTELFNFLLKGQYTLFGGQLYLMTSHDDKMCNYLILSNHATFDWKKGCLLQA